MEQLGAEAGFRFQGMAEGMTQIEQGADARFTLVFSHNLGFGAAADPNGVAARLFVAIAQGVAVFLHPLEERRIVD